MIIEDEKWHDPKWVAELSKEQAVHFLRRASEQATHLFERLEAAGKIRGNGWHLQQEVGEKAASLVKEHWA